MSEKQPYQETPILGSAEESQVNVEVKPSSKSVSFKTKVRFLNINRQQETIVSVQPPTITQSGILQFVLTDRLICLPLMAIERWEIEQLDEVKPSGLVVSMKDKQ